MHAAGEPLEFAQDVCQTVPGLNSHSEGKHVRAKKLLLAVVSVCAMTALVAATPDSNKAEANKARVLMLENAWNEAEKNNDAQAVEKLLSPSFAYTDSDGTFMNKQQFLASIKTLTYMPDQIVNENMNAWAHGDAVIVTGGYREKGSTKGKPYTRHGRFTDTWVEENGSWLCAASQETLIKDTK
jgi:ketosteroid isomerase-like protein